MTNTEHLHLHLPEPTDPVTPAPLNENFQALDAAVADCATLAEAAALRTALGTHGRNCRIEFGSYVGTGTCGEAHPTRLEFSIHPVVVIIGYTSGCTTSMPRTFLRGTSNYIATEGGSTMKTSYLRWGENYVELWYGEAYPQSQYNESGKEYVYAAIGYEPEETEEEDEEEQNE